jgi:long-chain acyl-CoA synthetase
MKYPYENLDYYTLPNLLDRSVSLYKDRPLFGKVAQKAFSYGEFKEQVTKVSELLQQYGIKKGDNVALLSENMPNWGIAYFSTTYFGAVIVPILVDFHKDDIHHILNHCQAKAVFVSSKYMDIIKQYSGSNIELIIKLDNLEVVESKNKKSDTNNKFKVYEDDLASLIYTSGTTGHSKGVMLTHKNLVTNSMSAYIQVEIKPEDIFLSILPLAHTFECTVGLIIPILHGSSVYYIDKAPTPSVLLKALKTVKPTMMISVPLIIEKIYKSKILPIFTSSPILKFLYTKTFLRKYLNKIAGKKLLETFGGRLRFFGIGGAKLSTYVEEFLVEANFPYIIGYGLTETSPLIAGSILGKKAKIGSTGIAMAGVEIDIKNSEEDSSKEGEIIVKSPSIMKGYYKDVEKTDEVIKDGWFYTGDLGYIDDEGYLFISGRSKNVIIGPAGENIYPEQIESIINQNELVLDSLVLEQDGKLIAKVYLNSELFNNKNITELLENMRLELNSKVSSFSKITKFILQEEEFIKTPTKKIKRYLYM